MRSLVADLVANAGVLAAVLLPSPPSSPPTSPSAPPVSISRKIRYMAVPAATDTLRAVNPRVKVSLGSISTPPHGAILADGCVEDTEPSLGGQYVPDDVELIVMAMIPDLAGLTRVAAQQALVDHGLAAAWRPETAPGTWVVRSQDRPALGPAQWGTKVLVTLVEPPVVATSTAAGGGGRGGKSTGPVSSAAPPTSSGPVTPAVPESTSGAAGALPWAVLTLLVLGLVVAPVARHRRNARWVRAHLLVRAAGDAGGTVTVAEPADAARLSLSVRPHTGSGTFVITERPR
jgi:hypothetical protein